VLPRLAARLGALGRAPNPSPWVGLRMPLRRRFLFYRQHFFWKGLPPFFLVLRDQKKFPPAQRKVLLHMSRVKAAQGLRLCVVRSSLSPSSPSARKVGCLFSCFGTSGWLVLSPCLRAKEKPFLSPSKNGFLLHRRTPQKGIPPFLRPAFSGDVPPWGTRRLRLVFLYGDTKTG